MGRFGYRHVRAKYDAGRQVAGLDSCPVGFAKYIEQTPVFHQLEIPKDEEVMLAVILGYGDEKPEPHLRVKNNAIFIDRMECC